MMSSTVSHVLRDARIDDVEDNDRGALGLLYVLNNILPNLCSIGVNL